ncbi:MAG: MgtC/SapB family protein [Gammaproteobacteria bacterium]|nr:MgtC/SapB family protein [Gammaproteobacteria bacterium]MBU2223343.1 MgtC/SapB family protein [Gammaproteobacteria bacterium]MBU2277531.1 MgtC/SapB family protein [Gammaproteobacteria bacterium]MBU2427472.1 MgtC/SapB family protein [Gammaproteobacteria bacterium]
MMELDSVVVRNFLLALAIGALVGIEREKHKTSEHPASFGGLRTFILIAQAGAISAWLSIQLQSPWLFLVTVLAVSAVVLTSYILENRLQPALGLTTEISAVTVCLLGGAVMFGQAELAVVLAILTSAILTFKHPLHGLVSKIDSSDLYAAIKLLLATFIVLPMLPNYTIDPWQALNPFKLWLLVILISALSLTGYLATRWLGTVKGTAIAGLTGGLVSSTAVTLSFSRQSKTEPDPAAGAMLASGILLAWLVMFVRVMVMVALVYLPLLQHIWLPFTLMALATLLMATYCFWQGHQRSQLQQRQVPLTNPFSLWEASKFGLLFAAVLLAVKLAEHYLPDEGLYVLAGIAGMTDVDAITLSMTELARQGSALTLAAGAVIIAALSNTVVKCGLVLVVGSTALRGYLLAGSGLILFTGLLTFIW